MAQGGLDAVMAHEVAETMPSDWNVNTMAAGQAQTPTANKVWDSDQLASMVRMRLRSPRGAYFDHWHFHKLNDEKVVVMIVNNGQVTMHEDEWPLFPSDALITKLRLLEK